MLIHKAIVKMASASWRPYHQTQVSQTCEFIQINEGSNRGQQNSRGDGFELVIHRRKRPSVFSGPEEGHAAALESAHMQIGMAAPRRFPAI